MLFSVDNMFVVEHYSLYILHPRQGMTWPTLLCLQPPGQVNVDDRAPFGHYPSQVCLECHSPRLSCGALATGCICVGGPCPRRSVGRSKNPAGTGPILACRRRLHAYHEPLLCEQVTLSETRTWPLFFYPSVPIESSNVLLFSTRLAERSFCRGSGTCLHLRWSRSVCVPRLLVF